MADENRESLMGVHAAKVAIKVTPKEPGKEMYAVDRITAIHAAEEVLDELPMRRARVIKTAIERLKNRPDKKYFSIMDLAAHLPFPHHSSEVDHPPSPATILQRRIRVKNAEVLDIELELERIRKEAYLKEKDNISGSTQVKERIQPKTQTGRSRVRDVDRLFDPVVGSIIFPAGWKMRDSFLREFFISNPDRYRGNPDGKHALELRGSRYFISKASAESIDTRLGKGKDHLNARLKIIKDDLLDGLYFISHYASFRENKSPIDFVLALGIMDYLKMQSQALFHAITYSERKFSVQEFIGNTPEHSEYRKKALKMMEQMTRLYYQTLLGVEFDKDLDFVVLGKMVEPLVDYTGKFVSGQLSKNGNKHTKEQVEKYFKYPEVNNPLTISLGAQEAVLAYPNVDTIVGIPTGGTETTIVIKLLYEKLRDKSLELKLIPVSVHSDDPAPSENQVANYLNFVYPNEFLDKEILLVDDNSATGETLGTVSAALHSNYAKKVKVHVTDFLGLLLVKQEDGRKNFHPGFSPTTIGVTGITKKGGFDYEAKIREIVEEVNIH